MTPKSARAEFSISRRTAMKMAAATTLAGRFAIPHSWVAAVDSTTWNWGGNSGHTKDMPGPGLDLDRALSEIWRMPGDEFGEVVGYLNGVVYTVRGNANGDFTGIAARNLRDGKLLWTSQAPNFDTTPATGVSTISFDSSIAIDNDVVLVTLNNGHLWAVDALTGDLLWDFDSESDYIGDPTVVDHIACFAVPDGICALNLGDRPEIRWKTETDGYQQWWWLGIDKGLVYAQGINGESVDDQQIEIRALAIEDGSEFWRMSGADLGDATYVAGLDRGNLLCTFGDMSAGGHGYLGVVDGSGSIKWSQDFASGIRSWLLGGLVATVTEIESYNVQGLLTENGQPLWELSIHANRWDYAEEPVFCAGIAYIAVAEAYTDRRFVVVADPGKGKLVGAIETEAVPVFVGDGVMLATDSNTDEIVAIGTGPAVVRAGGRAMVIEDAALRGAPGVSAVERETLTKGMVVRITGKGETANDATWFPATVSETGANGWLPANALEGMDGDVLFTQIDIGEFGEFTVY